MKAAIAANESARLAELQALEILDTLPEQSFDDLAHLAALICGTPAALVTLVDQKRQWFKARVGLAENETPRDHAFCAHAILQPEEMLLVPDAKADDRFADNPLVTGGPQIRFYAGSPLVTSAGHALGALCVIDQIPRTLSSGQREALNALARQAGTLLELRRQQILEKQSAREQEQARRILLETSRQLEEAQHTARIGSYRHDLKKDFWTSTATLNEIFGITDPAFAYNHQGWLQIVHPEEREELSRYFQQDVLQARRPLDKEYRIIRLHDRQERWVHSLARLVLDEKGEPVEIIGTAQDITERKRAETARARSEFRLRAILEAEPECVKLLDANCCLIEMNPAGLAMIEADSLDQVAGKDVCPLLTEKFREPFRALNRRAFEGLSGGMEFEIVGLKGTHRWLDTRVTPLRDESGNIVAVIGVTRDITDQKKAEHALQESEARYRLLLDKAPAPVFVQTNRRFAYANDAMLKLLGGTNRLQVLGEMVLDFVAPEFHDLVEERMRLANEQQTPAPVQQLKFLRLDGRAVDVEINGVPTEFNGHQGSLAFVHDISQRLRHEATLLEAKAAAEAGSAAKSEFLAMMSHEIRTPMNGVLGMANLLLDSDLPAKQRRLVEILRDSGSDLLVIINDILDFSKIEAGKLSFEPLPMDLRAAVEEVADLLSAKARKKNLEFLLRFAPGTPTGIVTDRIRLRQILLNLTDNAIKFTTHGHVLIEVTCLAKTAVEAQIKFAVTDTGLGIPKDKQHRMFQKFSQADSSTTRKFGGTGLGLAICKQLVELLGGTIGLKSEAGQGSTFWFNISFPVAADILPFSPAPDKIRGRRVLVVDDNAVHRELLREQLTAWKIHTETAADGTAALARLRAAHEAGLPFDTALVDHLLPEPDGVSLVRTLLAEAGLRATRLIALSSDDMGEEDARIRADGFERCLVKPIRAQNLFDALARKSGEDTALVARASRPVEPKLTGGTPVPLPLNLTVLVAEDNPTSQIVATAMLEKLGCRADIAANGLEAVEMFAQKNYDIVFMDLHMPVMDGAEATVTIREQNRNGRRVPIIAFTAGVQESDREKFFKAGVDDFILKPANRKTLEAALRRWTTKKEMGDGGWGLASGITPDPIPQTPDPIFNEEEALGFVDGDHELLGQLAVSFCETAPGLLQNLNAAIAQRDLKAATIAAHTLKGSARMFAATQTVATALAAEQAGKAGDWPPMETAARQLETDLAHLLPELLKLSAVTVCTHN